MTLFNFMMPGKSGDTLTGFERARLKDMPPQEAAILQSYLLMRERIEGCRLSGEFHPYAINIATSYGLPRVPPPARPFVVALRIDFTPRRWADLEIVHNKEQLSPRTVFLPDFPQLGIIPRDSARGARFATIGYMDRGINVARVRGLPKGGFARVVGEVEETCRKLGLRLLQKGADSWHDFSDLDAVLGIRDFMGSRWPSKPAAKMINAWIAGAPFIGGGDAAFLDAGEPDWNYLRARTAQELRRALERLADDSDLRDRLARHGRAASAHYGEDQIAQRWVALLKGRASELFAYSSAERHDGEAQFRGSLRSTSYASAREIRVD